MNGLLQDLRYALRQLRKTPGSTSAALLMLALGIGVNTAIFAVFYQVLLRTLSVRSPSELVVFKEFSKFETGGLDMWGGDTNTYFAYPAYAALRDGNRSLAGLAAATIVPATIVSATNTDKSLMQWVSGNYFSLLGAKPLLGRLLVPEDDVYHAGRPVAVMADNYWRSHFGSDSRVLNQQIEINGSPFTIVGIVPNVGLMDSAPPAVFVPISDAQAVSPAQDLLGDPLHRELNIIGRLAPGVTRKQAEAQLNSVWWNWRRDVLRTRKQNIPDEAGWLETHLSLVDGQRGIPLLKDTLGEPLTALEAMACLVLLIACANIATLLLAKAVSRRREFAVHVALGGSRLRVLRKIALEGFLLGVLGVVLGVLLGTLTLKLLIGMLPTAKTVREALPTQLGWATIAVCGSVGVLISILFSIVTAILSSRTALLGTLHPQSDSGPGGGATLRGLLVAGQISLTLVLLSCAAVFGWSLHQLRTIHPEYEATRNVLTFRVDASVLGKSDGQVRNEYAQITEAVRRQPGVQSVAYAAEGLIEDSEMGSNITVDSYAGQGNDVTPDENWINPNFFSTLRIPLVAGRVFTQQDTATSHKVAIVDQAFVKQYFAGDINKALIARFGFGGGNRVKFDFQIIGVVPTIRATRLTAPPSVPFIYLPYDQTYSPSTTVL